MKTDISEIYRNAWAFALACPLLFLVPVLVEFAQHVVEWQAGMYDSVAGAKAAEADPLRMQFGFAKTLALLLPGYWLHRYILFGRDPVRARQIEWPALGLWLVLFAIQGIQQAWGLFGPSVADVTGLSEQTGSIVGYVLMVSLAILTIYLTAWYVAWPLGNARIGPIRSIRIMTGHFWRTILYMAAGILPLMLLHYGLSFSAIFAPAIMDWPLLILDSFVVGLLALTMVGSSTIAARHAATSKGIDLIP